MSRKAQQIHQSDGIGRNASAMISKSVAMILKFFTGAAATRRLAASCMTKLTGSQTCFCARKRLYLSARRLGDGVRTSMTRWSGSFLNWLIGMDYGSASDRIAGCQQGDSPSRLRLLAPIRYLWIYHSEKSLYDIKLPVAIGVVAWASYSLITPKIPLFGDAGLLRFARDLLVMAVPFMIGALASVSMGAPGPSFDRRPPGAELLLDGEVLTLRQFLCYLLVIYLSWA